MTSQIHCFLSNVIERNRLRLFYCLALLLQFSSMATAKTNNLNNNDKDLCTLHWQTYYTAFEHEFSRSAVPSSSYLPSHTQTHLTPPFTLRLDKCSSKFSSEEFFLRIFLSHRIVRKTSKRTRGGILCLAR